MIGCDTVSAQGELFQSHSVCLSHHHPFFSYCVHQVCVQLSVRQSLIFSLSLPASGYKLHNGPFNMNLCSDYFMTLGVK